MIRVKRNSIRLMEDIDIPEKFHGEVMNICFGYLESPAEPLAVKVFSMSVLAKLAKEYPEIKTELKLIIEDQLPHQTAGFKKQGEESAENFRKAEIIFMFEEGQRLK